MRYLDEVKNKVIQKRIKDLEDKIEQLDRDLEKLAEIRRALQDMSEKL